MIKKIADHLYEYHSDSGNVYRVDNDCMTCLCKAWYYTKKCRHLKECVKIDKDGV